MQTEISWSPMTSFPPILGLADCPSAQAPLLLMLLLSEKRLAPQIWFEFMLKKNPNWFASSNL